MQGLGCFVQEARLAPGQSPDSCTQTQRLVVAIRVCPRGAGRDGRGRKPQGFGGNSFFFLQHDWESQRQKQRGAAGDGLSANLCGHSWEVGT